MLGNLFPLVLAALIGAPSSSTHSLQRTSNLAKESFYGKADGWSFNSKASGEDQDRFIVGKDSTVSHFGKASGTIRSRSADPSGFRAISQGIRADAYRGKRIRFQGFLKTNALFGWAGLWVKVEGKDRTFYRAYHGIYLLNADTDWAPYSVVVDVPKEATAIYFGPALQGHGQIWADDMSLEIVDPSKVSVTEIRSVQDYPHYLAQPENLDFTAHPVSHNGLDIPGWKNSYGTWDFRAHHDFEQTYEGGPTALLRSFERGNSFHSLYQEVQAQAFQGKRVRFQAYVMAATNVVAKTVIAIPDGGQAVTSLLHEPGEKPERPFQAPLQWKPLSIVVDVPKWAQGVQYGVELLGAGQVWIGHASLEVVNPETPLTNSDTSSIWTSAEDLRKLPLSPINLDFEG